MSNPVPQGPQFPSSNDAASAIQLDPMAALMEARNEMHRRRQQEHEERKEAQAEPQDALDSDTPGNNYNMDIDPNIDNKGVTARKRLRLELDDEEPISPPSSSLSAIAGKTSTSITASERAHYRVLADEVKSRRCYKGQAASILDDWVESADDPVARKLVILMLMLDLYNHSSAQPEEYKLCSGLKINMKKYMVGVICSPFLNAYRGDIVSPVLKAMRQCRVANVPDNSDEAKLIVLGEIIRTIATDVRNIIKKAVSDSVKGDKPIKIQNVMHFIIQKTGVVLEMTTAMLIRLAFIRLVVISTKGDTWIQVDRKMREWEEKWPVHEDLVEEYTENYNTDKAIFVNPLGKTKGKLIAADDIEEWQQACDDHVKVAGTERLPRKPKARG